MARQSYKRQRYPPVFLSPERTQFLVAIEVNRWLTAIEAASLSGAREPHYAMIARCERDGLTVRFPKTKRRPDSAVNARIELNGAHPAMRDMRKLLRKLATRLPVTRLDPRRSRIRRREPLRRTRAAKPDLVFGDSVRTKVLVLTMLAGSTTPTALARHLTCEAWSARRKMRALASAGLLVTSKKTRTALYSLNPRRFFARELKRLLRRIANLRPIYRARARALRDELKRGPARR